VQKDFHTTGIGLTWFFGAGYCTLAYPAHIKSKARKRFLRYVKEQQTVAVRVLIITGSSQPACNPTPVIMTSPKSGLVATATCFVPWQRASLRQNDMGSHCEWWSKRQLSYHRDGHEAVIIVDAWWTSTVATSSVQSGGLCPFTYICIHCTCFLTCFLLKFYYLLTFILLCFVLSCLLFCIVSYYYTFLLVYFVT